MGDVVGMMRSLQRMSDALINRLDWDEGKEFVHNEGLQIPPIVGSSVHREIEREKFIEF